MLPKDFTPVPQAARPMPVLQHGAPNMPICFSPLATIAILYLALSAGTCIGLLCTSSATPMLADIRVVRFGSSADGIAVPISSIRKYGTAPISRRRGGGKEYPALGRGDAKTMTGYARRMRRWEEWDDFLGVRVRVSPRRRRFEQTIDVYQPTGWNSPGVRKAVRIYFRVTLFIIKALISIPLAIIAIGAFWLLWVIITL
jgi:hypothetical protein